MAENELELSRQAQKTLDSADDKLKETLTTHLTWIALNPLSGKPLKGRMKGFRSYRVGDRRIIYALEDGVITIKYISPRDKAYR